MSLGGFRRSIAVILMAAMPSAFAAEYTIRWNSGVEVSGLKADSARALQQTNWSQSQWQALFSVYASQGSILTDANLPPIAGSYKVEGDTIRFTPQFPFQPNVNYRAAFRLESLPGAKGLTATISSTHRIEAAELPSTTVVTAIHPAVEALPENVLKFYLVFSAPMSGGHIYDHIHLQDSAGKDVPLPFLEIDEELWDPGMTRLTLFLDPGRIKRGVRPLEEIGPSLESGKSYALRISRNWRDANGAPLKSDFDKKFQVTEADREPPNPVRWKITAPKAKSRDLLKISFDEPLDHALAQRVLRVSDPSGAPVNGVVKLDAEVRTWTFTPGDRWKSGTHKIIVPTIIEDLAGNNIGKPFDVDLEENPRPQTNEVVRLSFTVK